jgi:2-C-methyl-D-erythritol 2,4-cyclodiphosphate synthase
MTIKKIKTGIGFDVHAFKKHRKLILGGVEIDFELGLDGHSDADVLIHSVIDALSGVCLNTDIGKVFPDSDMKYKGVSSRILLRNIYQLISSKNIEISNIDSVIIAQQPKLSPYIDSMRKNVAEDLKMDKADISIKATTTEYLGFTGRKEGIAAISVCLVSF